MECCRVVGFPGYSYYLKNIILRYFYFKKLLKIKFYRSGDHYTGGIVHKQNKQVAFDVIKEVRKNVTKLNK